MSKIFPSRFYGDPANVVDEVRKMRKREEERKPASETFRDRVIRELNEWQSKKGKK